MALASNMEVKDACMVGNDLELFVDDFERHPVRRSRLRIDVDVVKYDSVAGVVGVVAIGIVDLHVDLPLLQSASNAIAISFAIDVVIKANVDVDLPLLQSASNAIAISFAIAIEGRNTNRQTEHQIDDNQACEDLE